MKSKHALAAIALALPFAAHAADAARSTYSGPHTTVPIELLEQRGSAGAVRDSGRFKHGIAAKGEGVISARCTECRHEPGFLRPHTTNGPVTS